MEGNTLTIEQDFTNTANAIDSFTRDFVEIYKQLLMRDDKKASGNLVNSIKQLDIEFKGNNMSGVISLANYWKYVEYGRRPGKFPPPNKILKWIEIKPVLPRPINGIKPTNKQMAFLISRKIAREGIKPGNQFEEALNITWNKHKNNISNAISADLDSIIDTILFKNI